MNGAEHYRRAEDLLAKLPVNLFGGDRENAIIAAAQVHATLAQAAASAVWTTATYLGDSDEITDWARVVQPSAVAGRMSRAADRIDAAEGPHVD